MQVLLELLQSDMTKGRKALVFCSSMDSCRAVEHTMRERDIDTVCYHGEMPIQARKQSMAQFAGNHAPGSSEEVEGSGALVMIATDVAARGLDFPGTIDHVINFDMPKTAIDYLHRWVWTD
jgi:superfamily II DNA/RNA helicase